MINLRSFVRQPPISTSMGFLVNCLNRFKSSQQWLIRQKADPYVEKAKIYNYRYGYYYLPSSCLNPVYYELKKNSFVQMSQCFQIARDEWQNEYFDARS